MLQVTWVEHVEVDDSGTHNIYRPLVNSGLAFGAKRWTSTLERQCERFASAMATNVPPNDLSNTGDHKFLPSTRKIVPSQDVLRST